MECNGIPAFKCFGTSNAGITLRSIPAYGPEHMPVTIKVNGTSNSLAHKGCNGVSVATMPDVCKTPSPGGPVPMPYPNISQSITLNKGTKTVKVDCGMMAAIKGSEYSISNGDNPGVAGGVKSNTFMKESTWIIYSFDVKMDGKNACRLTDKKFQNHQNTVDASGEMHMALAVKALQDMVCECDAQVTPAPDDTCMKLGEKKHECMNNKISRHRPPPKLQGEKAYNRASGQPAAPPNTRMWLIGEGPKEFFSRIRGNIYPDAAILDDYGRPVRFAEFKFGCPVGVKSGKGVSTGTAIPDWSKGQKDATIALGKKQNPPITDDPELITNDKC